MLILKLGGASITDKSSPNTPNLALIESVAAQIAAHPQAMILIHGAGSYGHIIARQHQLHLGYQGESQRLALAQLQQQLHSLNRLVLDALAAAGVAAFPLHPASLCVQQGGRIASFFVEPVQRALEMKLLPVLYGDCVWDRAQGFSIISGDQLAVYLARALSAERLAFGTDVDGVLDAAGQLIPEMQARDSISSQAGNQGRVDVTGGMLGKLREIADSPCPAYIFNLQNSTHLARILAGQAAGTRINVDRGSAE